MSNRLFLFLLLFYSFIANSEPINLNTHKESFENGNPKYEISYKNKLKHGKEIFWYQSGNKKMQSHFVNGIEHGSWKQWYENGQIKLEVVYKNGKENH